MDIWGKPAGRIETQKLDHVSAYLMDAADLEFPDASFDLALCGLVGWDYCYDFVLDKFIGPDTRMREIYRVLREGGRGWHPLCQIRVVLFCHQVTRRSHPPDPGTCSTSQWIL